MARSPRKSRKSSSLAVFLIAAALLACNREKPAAAKPKPAATDAAPRTEVGDLMPAYSAKLLGGKQFDLAAEKGNVVLLNVWATWCGPCRFETPELQSLHQKYGPRGLKIVGVSVDDGAEKDVKHFVDENKVTYAIALDPDGHVANVLATTVLPTSVLIGRDGRIVWRQVGPVLPNDVATVDGAIQKALAAKS